MYMQTHTDSMHHFPYTTISPFTNKVPATASGRNLSVSKLDTMDVAPDRVLEVIYPHTLNLLAFY
jgi:hypothetical protein